MLQVADENVLAMAPEMVGPKELALLIAKALLEPTTESLSPTKVSKVLGNVRERCVYEDFERCRKEGLSLAL